MKAKTLNDLDDKNPSMMDDLEYKKADDWTDEKRILDPEAKELDDWDDEEDGEWEASRKDNPNFKGAVFGNNPLKNEIPFEKSPPGGSDSF